MENNSLLLSLIGFAILVILIVSIINISRHTKRTSEELWRTNKLLRMILKEQNEEKFLISSDKSYIHEKDKQYKV